MNRAVSPCPFHGTPCEYVPMAEETDGLRKHIAELEAKLAYYEGAATAPPSITRLKVALGLTLQEAQLLEVVLAKAPGLADYYRAVYDALWPSMKPLSAQNSVNVVLCRLRAKMTRHGLPEPKCIHGSGLRYTTEERDAIMKYVADNA